MKISFKVPEKKRESAIRKLDKYLMRAGFSRGEGVWIYNNGSNASINFQTKIRFSESNGTIQLDIMDASITHSMMENTPMAICLHLEFREL